mmetsp:Transcript_100700/g.291040  ORF Transcript_100700/g.291040 Transcript_100700/m.291040 type:complete len:240 (+) Transcript_100700:2346-3065(+)
MQFCRHDWDSRFCSNLDAGPQRTSCRDSLVAAAACRQRTQAARARQRSRAAGGSAPKRPPERRHGLGAGAGAGDAAAAHDIALEARRRPIPGAAASAARVLAGQQLQPVDRRRRRPHLGARPRLRRLEVLVALRVASADAGRGLAAGLHRSPPALGLRACGRERRLGGFAVDVALRLAHRAILAGGVRQACAAASVPPSLRHVSEARGRGSGMLAVACTDNESPVASHAIGSCLALQAR